MMYIYTSNSNFIHIYHYEAFRVRYSRRSLSVSKAINSEFVGFVFLEHIVLLKISSSTCLFPLLKATSIACLIVLSTLLDVVLYFFAISRIKTFCYVMKHIFVIKRKHYALSYILVALYMCRYSDFQKQICHIKLKIS